MGPWSALMERIAAALEARSALASVIAGPRNSVTPDAVMVRPAEPWISRRAEGRPSRFGHHLERYAAICAARVAEPPASVDRLYQMALAVMDAASDDGWDWESVSAVSLDETTETPLLVVEVSLTYSA